MKKKEEECSIVQWSFVCIYFLFDVVEKNNILMGKNPIKCQFLAFLFVRLNIQMMNLDEILLLPDLSLSQSVE